MNNNAKLAAVACGAGLGGVLVGACGAYLLARRRFEAEMEQEVESLKVHYRSKGESQVVDLVAAKRPRWVDVVEGTLEKSPDSDEKPEELVVRFPLPDGRRELNLADHRAIREDGVPYRITEAEFAEEHVADHQKLSITWYEGDQVLADDQEQPVPDILGTVGPDLAEAFGYGGDDPRIAYIRNERISVDFEVTRDDRTYAEALGYGNPKLVSAKKGRRSD
jgi:hypothetical protein